MSPSVATSNLSCTTLWHHLYGTGRPYISFYTSIIATLRSKGRRALRVTQASLCWLIKMTQLAFHSQDPQNSCPSSSLSLQRSKFMSQMIVEVVHSTWNVSKRSTEAVERGRLQIPHSISLLIWTWQSQALVILILTLIRWFSKSWGKLETTRKAPIFWRSSTGNYLSIK